METKTPLRGNSASKNSFEVDLGVTRDVTRNDNPSFLANDLSSLFGNNNSKQAATKFCSMDSRLACFVFNCISIFTDLVGFIITATKPGNFIELTISDGTSYALLSIFMLCSLSGIAGAALYESWMAAIPRFAYGMKALLAGLLGIFIVNVSFQLDSRHDNFATAFFPNRFNDSCTECWDEFTNLYYNEEFNGTLPSCDSSIDCFDFYLDAFNASLPKCQIQYPYLLANEFCDDKSLYNSRDCAFDGGDCLAILSSWYTSPYFVISVSVIGVLFYSGSSHAQGLFMLELNSGIITRPYDDSF